MNEFDIPSTLGRLNESFSQIDISDVDLYFSLYSALNWINLKDYLIKDNHSHTAKLAGIVEQENPEYEIICWQTANRLLSKIPTEYWKGIDS